MQVIKSSFTELTKQLPYLWRHSFWKEITSSQTCLGLKQKLAKHFHVFKKDTLDLLVTGMLFYNPVPSFKLRIKFCHVPQKITEQREEMQNALCFYGWFKVLPLSTAVWIIAIRWIQYAIHHMIVEKIICN